MKKLNLILLFVLGTLVLNLSSCKKKYSGCCKYAVTYVTPDYASTSFSVNKCLSDAEEGEVKPIVSQYTSMKDGEGITVGSNWEYKFTDNGCTFTKVK